MNKQAKITLIIIVLMLIFYSIYYINDYYPAQNEINTYLNGYKNVNILNSSNGLFLDGPGNDTAIIFYPGAKVEYTSYLPMFCELSNNGIDCYIVKMPLNLAIFGKNSADEIIDNTNYNHYIISGHSLGGTMAASYVNETNKSDALILLASYPTSEIEKPVLSIYGSEDKILNLEKYNESKKFYKSYFKESIINGANHGQFGYYGKQSGDGISKISPQTQQNESISEILAFIENI